MIKKPQIARRMIALLSIFIVVLMRFMVAANDVFLVSIDGKKLGLIDPNDVSQTRIVADFVSSDTNWGVTVKA